MTFKEAYVKMKDIANGRYFTLYYQLTEHSDGEQVATCRLYLDPKISSGEMPTWEAAFESLEKELHPEQVSPPDLTEAPE